MQLKKELNFFALFAIATGAMISSGIFILPGLAFAHAGPAVFVAYLLAGILAATGCLSIIELATAMPKAGGDYYFIARSLGPLIGTISGFLSWAALSLKTAFAIFGIAEVLYLLTSMPVRVSSIVLCLIFVVLNIIGVKEAAIFEILLVVGLLLLMGLFFGLGVSHVNIPHFEPFAPNGFNAILQTTGLVFVSFGGLLKVASIAEEIKNPKKNIPLGLLSAVCVVTILYTLLVIVTTGVLPAQEFKNSLSPIADAAEIFAGKGGYLIMTIAALLAFITTVNAGIMSASRYPLALSRDKLIPGFISRVDRRFQTPVRSIVITGLFILFSLMLPLETLVKAASTVVLMSYVLSSLSVIILRESRIQNYQPSFRAPWYPWLQLAGIFIFGSLIIDMGIATAEISLGLIVIGMGMYFFYGRKATGKKYALLHVLERITRKQPQSGSLEAELSDILHERDEVIDDQFDEYVKAAPIIDLTEAVGTKKLFEQITSHLTEHYLDKAETIGELLLKQENESSTVITPFVAIPNLMIEGEGQFHLALARCRKGIHFSEKFPSVKAVFVIIATQDKQREHLKALAAIAHIVQHKLFEKQWDKAQTSQQLRDILLLSTRHRM